MSSLIYGSSSELMRSESGRSFNNKTPFINLAYRVFDETEKNAEKKLARFNPKDLSSFWLATGGSSCFALFALAQSGNSEKLKSLLEAESFKSSEIQEALKYARKELELGCYSEMFQHDSHNSCIALLVEKLSN